VLTAVTALLFGGAPALRASRADVANALRDSVGGTEGRPGTRLRRALVAGRIALALTLLVGAGLMVRSVIRLVEADPGFRADNVLTLEIALPRHEYASGEGIPDFQRRLMERVATLPGVRAAGMVNVLPMARSSPSVRFAIEGRAPTRPDEVLRAGWRSITPGYLEALGIRLRRGRRPDRGDVRHAGPANPPQPEIDVPQAQWPSRSAYLAILVDGDPAALTAAVRREIVALEPDAAIARERTMRRVIDEYISPERLTSSLLGAFAVVALLLAATGPYGVIAYVVSRRMREIGIRMAVGARTADVVALVLREGTVMVLAGAAVGLALAFAVARALESVLFGATSTDPLVFAGVSSGCWSRPRSPRASSRRCAPRDWTRCGRCAATRPRGAAAGSSRTLRIRDRSSSANSASRTAVSGAGGTVRAGPAQPPGPRQRGRRPCPPRPSETISSTARSSGSTSSPVFGTSRSSLAPSGVRIRSVIRSVG